MNREKLGQALVKANKITKENLKYALTMHNKIGGDFSRLLVKLGYIVDDDLTATIAKLEGVATVDISSLVIPESLVRSLPREVIEKHNVMPIKRKDGQITLAMADVNDYDAMEEVKFLTGCRVEPLLAPREAIRKSIIHFYYGEKDSTLSDSKENVDASLESIFSGEGASLAKLQKATILLLLEKEIISKDELLRKFSKL